MPEMLRWLKQTCAPGPRDLTETETELYLSVFCGGTGQQWTAEGAAALGVADLGIALLEEVAIKPTIELPELTQDWETAPDHSKHCLPTTQEKTLHMNITRWSIPKSETCAPGPRRKDHWPHERLTQTYPWMSRSLWQRHGSAVACCRIGGTEHSIACMGPFEGGHHYFHYLHHSLAPGK